MKKYILLPIVFTFFLFNIASAETCLDLSKDLKYKSFDVSGSTSVFNLQTFLKGKNFLMVNPSGYFGVQTLKAVKDFQKANKINPTGFVGPLTRAYIKEVSCKENSTETTSNNTQVNTNTTTNTETSTSTNANTVTANNTTTSTTTVTTNTPNQTSDEIVNTSSSLRVRTDGALSIGKNSVSLRGTVTAGARSGTEVWFEITKNNQSFRVSETLMSTKVSNKSNTRFENSISNLEANTTYYFRACAGNTDLGQRSCGSTTSLKTLN